MVKRKNTSSIKKQSKNGFFQKHKNLKWLLPILFVLILFLFNYNLKKKTDTIVSTPTSVQVLSKTYTNSLDNAFIYYPASWTVKETHALSNRVVDDPNEINTATFTGKEGEIVIQWGPMGFGGGCDVKDHKIFSIKNKTMTICNGISSDGLEYWGGISNDRTDDRIVEVRASANKPLSASAQVIKEVLSTLTFK